MSGISIELDEKQLAGFDKLLELAPREIDAAAAVAVNRTITHVVALTSKSVRAEYLVKAGDIKRTLKTQKAARSHPVGVIRSTGQPLLLSSSRVSSATSRPLKAQVKRTSAARTVGGMFRGTSRSGYTGLMLRETRSSYPLRVPYGPSVPQMIASEDVIPTIETDAQAYLEKRFLHEIDYRLGRL